MEQIIEYIKKTYSPLAIILYGSYANGTNNLNSDFDALVISPDHEIHHDTSFVNGIQLDVFVYPDAYFDEDFDCNDFVQIFDGKIIHDTEDKGKELKNRVLSYIENLPHKTDAEIQAEIDWCIKMLERVKRDDVEGMYRWHWVLIDSLEIFCDVVHRLYLGPKKSLKWMEENYPEAFAYYEKALTDFDMESLSNWVLYLKDMNKWELRKATLEDKKSIEELFIKMLQSIYHTEDVQGYEEGYLDKFFDQRDEWICVAEKNDIVIGYVSIEVHHEEEEFIYLDDISVLGEYQNLGIGTALLNMAEQYARKINIPAIYLHVEKSNEAAFRLYERLGYEIKSEEGSRYRMVKEM